MRVQSRVHARPCFLPSPFLPTLATPFYYGIKIRLIGIVSYKLTPPRGCSSFARSLALLGSDEQVWILYTKPKQMNETLLPQLEKARSLRDVNTL